MTTAVTFEELTAEIDALPIGITAVFVTHADGEVEIVGTYEEADEGIEAVKDCIDSVTSGELLQIQAELRTELGSRTLLTIAAD